MQDSLAFAPEWLGRIKIIYVSLSLILNIFFCVLHEFTLIYAKINI